VIPLAALIGAEVMTDLAGERSISAPCMPKARSCSRSSGAALNHCQVVANASLTAMPPTSARAPSP